MQARGIDRLIQSYIKAQEESDKIEAIIKLKLMQKSLESAIKQIKTAVDNYALEAEDTIANGNGNALGYEIELRGGRTMYNYKHIPEWVEAKSDFDEVQDKYKTMMQAVLKGNPNANISEDGEILPLPEISYGKGSVLINKIK